jgi:3-deoxy-manno-octulosonate cytidylyltransferase (CMP-KDO synthetase)
MIVIIPARFASTRLPGKPLLDIAGQPMILHVLARARESGAARVVVATDDERIRAVVAGYGAEVCMTGAQHQSGTDRIAEVIAQLRLPSEAIVVNLQGDEPLMPPALIRDVAALLAAHPDAAMASACHAIHEREALMNPNVVKVVTDAAGYALYFSRAPIPWPRDAMATGATGPVQAQRHIGLYAYRAGFVQRYAAWPPCPLESLEALEQLRVLWHGERIIMHQASAAPAAGVDTLQDLQQVRAHFARAAP